MSGSAMPYVGSRISLISKSEIRYEGILYVINTEESTIALQNVRSYGTEGRVQPDVPPTDEVYDFIIFRGEDIKDLTVLEGSSTKPSQRAVLEDPAVVSVGPERRIAQQRPSGARESSNQEHRGSYQRDQQADRYGRNGQGQGARGDRKWEDRRDDRSGGFQRHGQQQDRQDGGYIRPHGNGQGKGQGKGYGKGQGKGYGKGHGKGANQTQHRMSAGHKGGPVGELTPNENAQTKAEIGTEEFDFSSANQKLERPAELAQEAASEETRVGYSKSKGFFDDISCDALDRKEGGRPDRSSRDKQRELDKETFGASALTRPFGYGGHRRYHHNRGGKGKAF